MKEGDVKYFDFLGCFGIGTHKCGNIGTHGTLRTKRMNRGCWWMAGQRVLLPARYRRWLVIIRGFMGGGGGRGAAARADRDEFTCRN